VSDVAERLERVRQRVARAALDAGRRAETVRVIAVSKTFAPESVREAALAGQVAFGENRVQEAEHKIPEVEKLVAQRLEWHMVGQLQRNKARRAVELFDVIHSVDRLSLARALSRAAVDLGRHPRVLLQVDVDEEEQKGGAAPEDLPALLLEVDALPALEPVGLMAIPRAVRDPDDARPSFARLRLLLERLNAARAVPLTELSMGMSADFEAAIREGATWVRVGTAIFGERTSA
jgi:pyridoxal phosphate enzyme (YggS family)